MNISVCMWVGCTLSVRAVNHSDVVASLNDREVEHNNQVQAEEEEGWVEEEVWLSGAG